MQSPGHRQHPEHTVRDESMAQVVKVKVNGVTIAESDKVIKVVEDGAPVRYYFPRDDVRMETLSPSTMTTECPFKGHATYFDLEADGQRLKDAVWTYESPYDEHADLAHRVAFYDDKQPAIRITAGN